MLCDTIAANLDEGLHRPQKGAEHRYCGRNGIAVSSSIVSNKGIWVKMGATFDDAPESSFVKTTGGFPLSEDHYRYPQVYRRDLHWMGWIPLRPAPPSTTSVAGLTPWWFSPAALERRGAKWGFSEMSV